MTNAEETFPQAAEGTAQIGVVGLAVMGSNLARNFAHHGHTVAVFNRTTAKTEKFIAEHGDEGEFVPSETIEKFVASLEKPRRAIIMVQAGKATDAVIGQLADAMEDGDVIIDGGNALFTDTIRREREMAARNRHFVGAGISGGEEGALNGPSIMPGGPRESWESLGPLLESIAARAEDGTPCVTHVGPDGAGHFVKMVHNGIEYADMQVIGEAYQLLRFGAGLEPAEIADIFTEWNSGKLGSYLIEITAEVLRQVDAETGKPLVDVILDAAGQKGTGRWTVKEALDLGIPTTGIGEAVFARALSSSLDQRAAAQGNLPAGTLKTFEDLGVDRDEFVEKVRKALYASKLVAYAQGFDEIKAGSAEYGWGVNPGDMAMIWRAGCIIRAVFLERIKEAYDNNPELTSLLLDPYFNSELTDLVDAWRDVVVYATRLGLPAPVFTSSLSYYDSLRAERLPAAVIQGQRDFFGAHTYKRVDKEGTFHTLWSGDRSEVEA
ncbi:NADP-dependent phosphogluconate dehydrogenase [Corynebacterium frankenforstense]|uniref:NADP-dependent phosphogluconate dehydrogenase n=1 Tax=Corynebacterium frankenforstense TaxID=1230998 RepID=UPI0026ECDED2|nr:NADP-dependent phosphogluconate dehydrogenase [Corynebacterium frankenforstense]